MKSIFTEIDVIILCGGKGTRLRPVVSDRPKSLAVIGDTTFLDILIESLTQQGFTRFILCVGYMKDQMIDHFKKRDDISIIFSEEEEALGTGGALKNARSLIRSETFLVLNGDSICDLDFEKFYRFHKNKNAVLSIALAQTDQAHDYGSVMVDHSDMITSFREKVTNSTHGLINAGIYLMRQDIFSFMPKADHFSLETDFFPEILQEKCAGFIIKSELIDIGTPDRYKKAADIIRGKS